MVVGGSNPAPRQRHDVGDGFCVIYIASYCIALYFFLLFRLMLNPSHIGYSSDPEK